MNTQAIKRSRPLAPNGRVCKQLAGDYPRFVLLKDGSVDELTHQERAILNFRRALPDDLKPEFDNCLKRKGDAFKVGLAEFDAKLAPRRSEMVWPPRAQA